MIATDVLPLKGRLRIKPFHADGTVFDEETVLQTICTTGKNWLETVLEGTVAAADILKWHQSGVGVTVAAAGDTSLSTGIYSRVAGTRTTGASANIFESVATISYTGTRSITEWGIFTTSTSGSIFSHKTFAAKAVVNGDSIQFTWDLTIG